MTVAKPWSVQVELVEGCSRLCSFCGLNAIRNKPGGYKRMTMETAVHTARGVASLNDTARVEFAMHGEPMMHPDAHAIFAMFRRTLPEAQMQVTTNGVRFRKRDTVQEEVERVFEAGIDFIIVDTYEPERLELQANLRALSDVQVLDFYDDMVPRKMSPWANHRRKMRRTVVIMDDLGARDGEHASRVVLNHAGAVPGSSLDEPLAKTCTNPFREVAVTWNGEVRICCMDWMGEYVCGNVNDTRLHRIWSGPAFEAARAYLSAKRRDALAPCARCNKGAGARAGLLPSYPPPTEADAAAVRIATRRRLPLWS